MIDEIKMNVEKLTEELAAKIVIPETNFLDKLENIPPEVWAGGAFAVFGILFLWVKV